MKNISIFCLIACLLLGAVHPAKAQLRAAANPHPNYLSAWGKQDNSSFDFGDSKKKKKKKKKKASGGGGEGMDFQHGIGATLFYAPSNAGDVDDNSAVAYGLSYYPSIRIKEIGDALSLRLGAAPTLGISGSVNSQSGGSLAFAFELPIDAELHFGNQELEGFGGHIGAGFAYNRIITSDFGNNKAFGPHLTAGVKVLFKGEVYSLRVGYLLNLNSKKDEYGYEGKNVISGSVLKYF